MTIVVTGATGQVGLHLVDALRRSGHAVRAVTLPSDDGMQGRDVEVVHADVRDAESLRRAFADADTVYHLAAVVTTRGGDDPVVWGVNATGAGNAAKAARLAGVRKFVHFSSMVVFDPHPRDRALDEDRPRVRGDGHSQYSRSKVVGEMLVRREIDAGLDAVVVHPTVIVGPHETHHAGIVHNLIAKQFEGRLPAILDGGFNLVDVLDVVDGAIAARDRGRTGESYILGGRWYTVAQLVALAGAMTGKRAPRVALPIWMARAALPWVDMGARLVGRKAPFNGEELNQLVGNPAIVSDKAARELSYRPRPIEDSLSRVRAWLAAGQPRREHTAAAPAG